MIVWTAAARRGLRWGAFVLATAILVVGVTADPADARGKRKKVRPAYNPPYAAIVVDVNAGKVLHAKNPDSLRHPASLTKIMTLYLLFEQIEAGRFSLESRLPVSSYAASRPPSKLGVQPGQTISVEDAIQALVTKSANDVSVVISEAVAGSEERFARMMTAKARAIGMSKTVYRNANGLPDPQQVTTARDQATLGQAIQERFPKLYPYFATARFHYRGRVIANHNKLLGRVVGVDGIKTGFIRASGFNLVSSMRHNNRHVVAVVIGGTSGRARDARMRSLLEEHIVVASPRRTAPRSIEVAESPAPRQARSAIEPPPPPMRPTPVQSSASASVPAPGSADPIKPLIVRTMAVRRTVSQASAVVALAPMRASDSSEPLATPMPPAIGDREVDTAEEAEMEVAVASAVGAVDRGRPAARGGWIIQVGAFPAQSQAEDRLEAAKSVAGKVLSGAEPFTETVTKGQTKLFRARFAGFDRQRAEAACRHFKRNEIACLAMRQ